MSIARLRPATLFSVAIALVLTMSVASCDIPSAPDDSWTVMLCCGAGDLALGDTTRFEAIARHYFIGNGPEINSNSTPERYTWRSTNVSAATVDWHGLVRPVASGYTLIEAQLHGPHGGRTGRGAVMTVPRIDHLDQSLSADTISAGDTVQVRIAALDSLGLPVPGAVIRPYISPGLTMVHAEASVLENPGGRYWLAPASITYRVAGPGRYVVTVTRSYIPSGGSYSEVSDTVVVR
jgi:hypothetical protein